MKSQSDESCYAGDSASIRLLHSFLRPRVLPRTHFRLHSREGRDDSSCTCYFPPVIGDNLVPLLLATSTFPPAPKFCKLATRVQMIQFTSVTFETASFEVEFTITSFNDATWPYVNRRLLVT